MNEYKTFYKGARIVIFLLSLPLIYWLYYQLDRIPSDIGLLEQYCYQCEEVVDTVVIDDGTTDSNGKPNAFKACVNCGNPTWFRLFPILTMLLLAVVDVLLLYTIITGQAPSWLKKNNSK